MYEIYYYNQEIYYLQGRYNTLKEAKAHYNECYKGFISKGDRIYKKYK